ncbi:SPASM domain-containing protein [Marispirochaeta sp.]|jgi:Fe-coproporphyrin III synthase|uniref:SPASM domain-containing protein n=1 Tax=Marispirochaeta sp. TaxID=2038653 RepID=UPI0029C8A1F5|nr:SPASM domain-containing protein [Marispirochaeta sp.]
MKRTRVEEEFVWNKTRISYPADAYPESLYIELTSRCNFNCKGCFRKGFTEDFGDMKDSTFQAILSALESKKPEGRVNRVFIGGIGEPMLHPRFPWFLQELSSRVPVIEMQTNGSFLDDRMIDFLIDAGLEKLVLSYETGSLGHAAGSNLDTAGVSGTFPWQVIERVKEAKRKAGKRRPLIAVEWVLTRESLKDLETFGAAIVTAEADEIVISNMLPVNGEGEKEILYRIDGYRDGEGSLLEPLFRSIRHRIHYTIPQFSLRTERNCSFIEKQSTVIRWDGEVAPCFRFLHDGTERIDGKEMELISHSFGNIDQSSLYDIWNSREYIWFRISVSQSFYPSCTDCTLKAGCEYLRDSSGNCWGLAPSCGNCLWARQIVVCP